MLAIIICYVFRKIVCLVIVTKVAIIKLVELADAYISLL